MYSIIVDLLEEQLGHLATIVLQRSLKPISYFSDEDLTNWK